MTNIDSALRARHSKDLVIGECKNGPTWYGNHLRLDYWVLRSSWARPAMIGYEVKSSRADWLKDQKWQGYGPLCNELWFIADPRHILPGELPDWVGHLRPAGGRLVTVKRAVWREIEFPSELVTYILMSRVRTRDGPQPSDQLAYWRAWLAEKQDKQQIGHRVGRRLRELYDQRVRVVEAENRGLKERVEGAERLASALAAKGIDWRPWTTVGDVEQVIAAPRWDRAAVESARNVLDKLLGQPAHQP